MHAMAACPLVSSRQSILRHQTTSIGENNNEPRYSLHHSPPLGFDFKLRFKVEAFRSYMQKTMTGPVLETWWQ